MQFNLTAGGCESLALQDKALKPTVQIVSQKRMSSSTPQGGNTERYRLVLSDGQRSQHAMLATQLNSMVSDGVVAPNSVVVMEEYLCNMVQGRRIVIVLKMQVLGNPGHVIGSPVDENGQPAAGTTPQAQAAPQQQFGAPPGQQQGAPPPVQQHGNNNNQGNQQGGGMPQQPWGQNNNNGGGNQNNGGAFNQQGGPPPQQQQQQPRQRSFHSCKPAPGSG